MNTPTLHTAADAAALLGVSESWLANRVRRQEIPHRRLGRFIRFSDDDLQQIVAASANTPPIRPTGRKRRSESRRAA